MVIGLILLACGSWAGICEAGTQRLFSFGRPLQRRAAPQLPLRRMPEIGLRFTTLWSHLGTDFQGGAQIGNYQFYWGKRCPSLAPLTEKLLFHAFLHGLRVAGLWYDQRGTHRPLPGSRVRPRPVYCLRRLSILAPEGAVRMR